MKIVEEKFYDGAREKITRLGIHLYEEILGALRGLPLTLLEQKDSNSGAEVRQKIDNAIEHIGGWKKTSSGDIDWRKCFKTNGSEICIGVEIQVSARSDLVVIDIMHLRNAIESGLIDVGVIVVPSDLLSRYLTDRGPSFRETINAVEQGMRSQQLPFVVVAVGHDGAGKMLPKRKKRTR